MKKTFVTILVNRETQDDIEVECEVHVTLDKGQDGGDDAELQSYTCKDVKDIRLTAKEEEEAIEAAIEKVSNGHSV